nr:tyrosine-protein phosphatase [Maliibacterium massiliense]
MSTVLCARPLPLAGASNARDLGVYRACDGKPLAPNRVFRSNALAGLTPADRDLLYHVHGVRLVIDLRTQLEIDRAPDALDARFIYRNVPLIDNVQSIMAAGDLAGALPQSMGQMYCGLLRSSGAQLARVFSLLLEHQAHAALFHCTAGKDRTGVVSMLLLNLCGVGDDVIIADYAATQAYMGQRLHAQRAMLAQMGLGALPDYLFEARAADMVHTLRFLADTYHGAAGYLAHIGMTGAQVAALTALLRA